MILSRNETFKEYISLYPVTCLIVAANTLVMIFSLSIDGGLSQRGGISQSAFVEGEYYRLVTYSFIHNGFSHYFMNMAATVILAPPIERILGKARYFLLFALSVILSGLAIVLLAFNVNLMNAGESGFGYALLGYYLYLILFDKRKLDSGSAKAVIVLIIAGWITTFIFSNISILGHAGGFVSGFLLAPVLQYTQKNGKNPLKRLFT
ncbi:rhomboid family intramembrane serine protease [Peribacillus sp. B-H-3]|uniref:rhomboid family intramembrane serine protease n=1 Tax=Peribacillus sp. B-H-3 TaxID=3400420 RepID=UPI003B015603